MKNKVRIFGKDVKRAVRRTLMENIVEDYEMKDTYSRSKYKQSPREKEIEGVFGQYGEEIPPAVLRYMRKNPQAVIKRLYDVYGNEMLEYIRKEIGPESFYDEAEEGFDDYGEEEEEEVEVMGEVEEVAAHQTYDFMNNPKDWEAFNVEVGDNSKIKAREGGIIDVFAEEDKPSKGLSKKKKSAVAKKARRGGDIGKKGKNFDKIAKKAAKRYGSEEAGERVAAAAMWKNIKR